MDALDEGLLLLALLRRRALRRDTACPKRGVTLLGGVQGLAIDHDTVGISLQFLGSSAGGTTGSGVAACFGVRPSSDAAFSAVSSGSSMIRGLSIACGCSPSSAWPALRAGTQPCSTVTKTCGYSPTYDVKSGSLAGSKGARVQAIWPAKLEPLTFCRAAEGRVFACCGRLPMWGASCRPASLRL